MRRVKHLIHCLDHFSGKGVVITVMDSGAVLHPELIDCFLLFKDFVNGKQEMYDDNGHGTHVCGIIAGRNIGMAPESKLIVLKVLDENGKGSVECSMRGFRWILENQERYNIRVVNISMGMENYTNELAAKQVLGGVELLWDMGIVVVASAGNRGPKEGSITVPGLQKKIITVGSSDIKNSGRGSWTEEIWKPDLVTPGARVRSCNYKWQEGKYYIEKSGTSMSTPVVSGAIACLLSQNPNLPNTEVKKILKKSCENIGLEPTWQGNGLLNMKKLMKL